MVLKSVMWILVITGLVAGQYYQDSGDNFSSMDEFVTDDTDEGLIRQEETSSTMRPRPPIVSPIRFNRPVIRTNRIGSNGVNGGYGSVTKPAPVTNTPSYTTAAPVTAVPTYSTIRSTVRPITQSPYYTPTTTALPLTQVPSYTTTTSAPITQTTSAYQTTTIAARPITTSYGVAQKVAPISSPIAYSSPRIATSPTYQSTSNNIVQSRPIQRPIRVSSDSSYGVVTNGAVASSYGQTNTRSGVVGRPVAVARQSRISQVEIGYPY